MKGPCRGGGDPMSSLYSERLLDHFRNPRHAGVLPAPAVTVTAENPACGDVMRLSAEVEGGVVRRAGFQVRGCTASIAAGSALAEWLTGRASAEVERGAVRGALETALGELPPASAHVVALAEDAVGALRRLIG